MKISLLLTLMLLSLQGLAQTYDTVFFAKDYINLRTGTNAEPVYKYSGDTIIYKGKPYKITLPSNIDTSILAFATLYFTGWEASVLPRVSPILVSNYAGNPTTIYVDYNQNMDFSDDGDSLVLEGQDDSVTVYYRNSQDENALFPILLQHVQFENDEIRQRSFAYHSSKPDAIYNTLTDISYWVSGRRKNSLLAYALLLGDSVQIGIHDYNCNGLYNDKKGDRVLVANKNTGEFSPQLFKGAYTLEDTTVIKMNGKFYEVGEIEPTGKYMVLKTTALERERIEIGEPIPDLKFNLVNDSTVSFHQVCEKGKYTLIDIWGTWCAGCVMRTPELIRMDSVYNSKLKIVGLNFGDKKEDALHYISATNIQFTNGFATKDIREKLLVDFYPYYLLLDENKKIVLIDWTLEGVEKILKGE